jgi:hypothetical protein
MNNEFESAAWEAFQQAAADKYDFTTCQRSDGSKYGSSGRCLKGSETTPASQDKKASSKKSGGGGGKQETQREKNIRIANEEEARLKKAYGRDKGKGNPMDRLTSADVMKAVGTHD